MISAYVVSINTAYFSDLYVSIQFDLDSFCFTKVFSVSVFMSRSAVKAAVYAAHRFLISIVRHVPSLILLPFSSFGLYNIR